MQIIDKVVIFHPMVRTWGGKKKLDPSDIDAGGNIPPEELVSLGNKRIVPMEALRPFDALKKRLNRTMERYGVRLIGGYAVAEDSVDSLVEKMKEFEIEFERLKDYFVVNFDQHVGEQTQKFTNHAEEQKRKGLVSSPPDWGKILQSAADEIKPGLNGRFTCGYKAYKLVPPGSSDTEQGSELSNRFISDDEFVTQAAKEVAGMADEALSRLSAQEQIKQVFLNRIRHIREKLLNLSSLDRKLFGGAVGVIDMALGEMPPKGPIEGRERKLLTSLMLFLRQMNKEPVRTAFLDGDYDNPEALMKAMGYDVFSGNAPESDADPASDMAGQEESETEEAEAFTWF